MFYMDRKALRELRCSHFLTQPQLAEIAGYSYQTVCSQETGKRHSKVYAIKVKNGIEQYAKCYEILKDCVSDIDYYDRAAAEAERAEAFEESRLNRRLEK